MSTMPPLPPEPPSGRVPPPPPPPPPPSGPDAAPGGDQRRTITILTVVSIVLAVALVAMSLLWWSARDGSDDAATAEAAAVPTPSTEAPTDGQGAGDGRQDSGDGATPPSSLAPESGDAPDDGHDRDDGLLDGLGQMLDELLGGDLGDLGDLGGLGDLGDLGGLGGLSPECLDTGVDDLLGSVLGGDELSGSLDEQIREIADRVAEQRELEFRDPVDPVLLAADDFDRRIAEMVETEYEADEADLDSRMLSMLGAIPGGTDLAELQSDLLAGQVAGFYDPDTGEIVVRDDGDGTLDTNEQITLAHELDHALTDQALGLPDISVEGQTDRNLAALALVEGDATLLMQQYALAHIGLLDQLGQLDDPAMAAAQAELDQVPPYLREEMMFPYLAGLTYACGLHADGGWPAVDAAYADLPVTTAEVLFPDRAGAPVDPDDPGELPSPWTVARRDTIGAAQLGWLFGAPGGDEANALADAGELTASWAGGELVLATDGDDSALGVALVEQSSDGVLCDAVDEWYGRSFDDDDRAVDGADVIYEGSTQSAVLRCDGSDVRLGIAPDLPTAAALVG